MRLGNARYWRPGTAFWDRRAASIEAQVSHPIHSLVEMGWGGAAGGVDELIRKMGATAYYPDLFAWAFGTPASTRRACSGRSPSSCARWSRIRAGGMPAMPRSSRPTAPDRALDVDLPNFTPEENRGRHLFMASVAQGGAGCASCHMPPTFALDPNAHSNGLDAGETRLFKAPSLRNVGLTGPYMHDGRFTTLVQVVDFYGRRPGRPRARPPAQAGRQAPAPGPRPRRPRRARRLPDDAERHRAHHRSALWQSVSRPRLSGRAPRPGSNTASHC